MNNIQKVRVVGVDLAKNFIQIHAVDETGEAVFNRRFTQFGVLTLFESMTPACVIGLEACGGAHHWTRILVDQGHEVRMMPAQYVKSIVKTNKNDAVITQMLPANIR